MKCEIVEAGSLRELQTKLNATMAMSGMRLFGNIVVREQRITATLPTITYIQMLVKEDGE